MRTTMTTPLPTPLHLQTCTHQAGAALTEAQCQVLLAQTPQWSIAGEETEAVLQRTFAFPDFHATMGFVNAVAHIANTQDHHPDMQVSYNRCTLRWNTHSVQGLSINDFICAAQTDLIVPTTANMGHS